MRRSFIAFVALILLSAPVLAGDTLEPPVHGAVLHRVSSGESWKTLSALYAVSVDNLKNLNPQDELSEGAVVWVPPSPGGWPVHRVVSGQTLWRISKGYGIPVEQIKQANGLVSDELMPGNVLVLPRAQKPEWGAVEQVASAPAAAAEPIEKEPSNSAETSLSRTELSSRSGKPQRYEARQESLAGWVEVRLPDNRRAWVKSSDLVLGSWQPQTPEILVAKAREFMGVPYKWGGTDPNGYDCSGFVQEVFRLAGHQVPRLADVQYEQLDKVENEDLRVGDLVFFNTDGSGVSHVGIYTGNNSFLHASSSRGVVESNLEESYYKTRFVGAARLPAWQAVGVVSPWTAAEK